jgi:hypothetical protein
MYHKIQKDGTKDEVILKGKRYQIVVGTDC